MRQNKGYSFKVVLRRRRRRRRGSYVLHLSIKTVKQHYTSCAWFDYKQENIYLKKIENTFAIKNIHLGYNKFQKAFHITDN